MGIVYSNVFKMEICLILASKNDVVAAADIEAVNVLKSKVTGALADVFFWRHSMCKRVVMSRKVSVFGLQNDAGTPRAVLSILYNTEAAIF